MEKEEMQRRSYQRMASIEDKFGGGHVPPEIQQFWLLQFFVAEGLNSFMRTYGFKLHAGDCNDGREEMRWGPLSGFELDAIAFLNNHIEEGENHARRLSSMPSNVQRIGIART